MKKRNKGKDSLRSSRYSFDELNCLSSQRMRVPEKGPYISNDDYFDRQYQIGLSELQNREMEEYEEIPEDTQEVEMISASENKSK